MTRTIPLRDGPTKPWVDRAIAVAVAAAAVAVTALLLGTTPDPKGYDTHVQLGLPPCGWPKTHGMPCPTCGVTTAASYVVHLQWLSAVRVQPFGAALAFAGLWAGAAAIWCLVRGRSYVDLLVRLPLGWLLLGFVVLFAGSWAVTYATFVP